MDNYYGIGDLEKILGVPKSTIYFWRQNGKKNFPEGVKVGRYIRWEKSTFDAWYQEEMRPTNLADTVGEVFSAMTEVTTAIAQDTDLKQPLLKVKETVDYALANM